MGKYKIIIILTFVLFFSLLFLFIKSSNNNDYVDTISYKGKTYIYLEYNMDIFYYDFNSNNYYEEDIIHPIKHKKWDMVYFNGDLFVYEKEAEEAKKYYSKDNNYEWFIDIDIDDYEYSYPIIISQEELNYLYDMDNMKKNQTILFEDIEMFGTLKKISKDQTISSILSLARYNNYWYWKTEIIDDTKEAYYEYVIKLPKTLNTKINKIVNKI